MLNMKFRKIQQRIPNELLCALAESLLDNTVFRIVNTLMDIQHVTEKQIFHQRLQVTYNQTLEIQNMILKHQDTAVQFANTQTLKLKHKIELKEFDKKSIQQLDEKLHDQQRFLEKAGVPGFEVTDNPMQIQVQIRLLDFILRLSRMDLPDC
ncbi:gonadal protein gdl isoform X2 [Cimex lectularius]|uniref:Gonadal protein gdl n=1 Tax=Cimex lectularius TaxID=79782 RepID=A0A8I6SMC3_CIMLE|nr:gonadal protein gdl isoform X2 [Cimex lectularius]